MTKDPSEGGGCVEPAVLGQSFLHGRVAQGEAGAAEHRVTDSSSEPGSLAEREIPLSGPSLHP